MSESSPHTDQVSLTEDTRAFNLSRELNEMKSETKDCRSHDKKYADDNRSLRKIVLSYCLVSGVPLRDDQVFSVLFQEFYKQGIFVRSNLPN